MKARGVMLSLLLTGCASFGSPPNDDDKKSYKSSAQFNEEKGAFQNRLPNLYSEMNKKAFSWKLMKEWFAGGGDRVPMEKLPEVKPVLKDFLAASDELKIIWFGHSSFLLNMDGKIILVDPVFSVSASPFDSVVKRFQEPVLSLDELPKVDYVVISHDHYDHLDMRTIEFFADKKVEFVVPLGVGSHLKKWGIPDKAIVEKDWWESHKVDGVEFVATPAQHFSGRGVTPNQTLWASWVMRSKNHNIYFSGDSGYDVHFKEIGDKLGPFDVAFIESGQYNERWKEVHMLPEEGVKAFHDLKARSYFPVHWGMFELSIHSWYEPIEKIYKFSKEKEFDLLAPKIGEVLALNKDRESARPDPWWESVARKVKTAATKKDKTETYGLVPEGNGAEG